MNAKIIFPIILILITASYAVYTSNFPSTTDQKTTTVESFRIQAQEARDREIKAQEDRQERENNLSRAIWLECFDTATSQTGSNFASQQKESYECWKQNTTNINSWTVTSANSEVPPKWIISKTNDITINLQQATRNISNANAIQWAKKINSKPVEKIPKANSVTLGTTSSSGKWIEGSKGTSKEIFWKSYEIAIVMIKKWEWLRLHAYPDYGHCSIGYGSYAKSCDEVITISEANRRLWVTVQTLIKTVQKDFPTLTSKQQGALASFAYNCSKWYKSLAKNWLKYHGQWCKTAWGIKLGGLERRRAEESAILFKN